MTSGLENFTIASLLAPTLRLLSAPECRNTENFGYKPSAYTSGGHPQLDLFSGRLGVPGVWSKTTGAGFGAIYSNKAGVEKGSPYFTVAANYVAEKGNLSNPNIGGFMTDGAEASTTAQLAYGTKQWGLAAGYRYSQCGSTFGKATEFANPTATPRIAPTVLVIVQELRVTAGH